jgi:hypothetical protein
MKGVGTRLVPGSWGDATRGRAVPAPSVGLHELALPLLEDSFLASLIFETATIRLPGYVLASNTCDLNEKGDSQFNRPGVGRLFC